MICQKLTFFEASQNLSEIFFQNFLFVLLQDLSGNFQIYKNYGNPIYIGRDIQLSKSCPIYGTAVPKGLKDQSTREKVAYFLIFYILGKFMKNGAFFVFTVNYESLTASR